MDINLLKSLVKKKEDQQPTSTSRLQSLRPPRDLSLGGTKPKKVYTPNINVVRKKDKAKEVIKNLERKRKEKAKFEPKPRDNSRFVQSSGIFSDGSIEQRRSTSYGEKSHYRSADSEPTAGISMPTYKKHRWNVDKQKENVILDELKNQETEDEEKMSLMPVMWNSVGIKDDQNIINVKTENNMNGNDYTETIASFFHKMDDETNPRLSLLKLPDSFAGKGLSDDPNVKKIFDYPLNVMLEGKIGTLKIRRSGKMYIKIGNVKYQIESTDFFDKNETVATFSESSYGREPQLAILGNIEKRFVMNPIWKCLLES